MPTNTPLHRYFDVFNQSYDAIMDAVQSGAQRSSRLSSVVLSDVQRGQHEMLELGRAFVAEPRNVRGTYRRVRESAERGRARRRELRRQVIDELAQSRSEARETFSRIATQQRIAEDATMQLARDLFHGMIDRAEARLARTTQQSTIGRVSPPSTDRAHGSADGLHDDTSIPTSTRPDSTQSTSAGEPAPEWMTSPSSMATSDVEANPSAPQQRTRRAGAVHDARGKV